MTEPHTGTRSHIFRGQAAAPVFVGGLMRSGTSLTRVLLGQHPDFFGTFETHWFTDAIRLDWNRPGSWRMELLLTLLTIDEREYQSICRIKRGDPGREFIDIVLDYCARREGKPRWVEKTPDNIRYWSLIRRQWPDAYLVHVTRDFKDMFASWKTKRGETLENFLKAVEKAYQDIAPLLGADSDHYLEVDYNAIVTDTEATMRRVLEGIGAVWDDGCARIDLDRTTRERGRIRGALGRESPTAVALTKPIFTSGIGQWRAILTPREAKTIDTELAPYYDIFGDRWAAVA